MNLIPLIDIMLVLMIIFLVTATVANPSIPLALPKTTAEIVDPPPKAITISINRKGGPLRILKLCGFGWDFGLVLKTCKSKNETKIVQLHC